MADNEFTYRYQLKTFYPQECESVIFAFTQAGWEVIGIEPDSGEPKYIVLKWAKDSPPYYPYVNLP